MDTVELKEVVGEMCRLSIEVGRYEESMEAVGSYARPREDHDRQMMALWKKLDAIIEEGQL